MQGTQLYCMFCFHSELFRSVSHTVNTGTLHTTAEALGDHGIHVSCRGRKSSSTQTNNSFRNDLFTLHPSCELHAMVRNKYS